MGLASVPVKMMMWQIAGSKEFQEARVLGVDAQEQVLPGLDFSTQGLLEAQTLVLPLLRLLAELRD